MEADHPLPIVEAKGHGPLRVKLSADGSRDVVVAREEVLREVSGIVSFAFIKIKTIVVIAYDTACQLIAAMPSK